MSAEKFTVGQKVWFVHTGEWGIITRLEEEGFLIVETDGLEIPVLITEISPAEPSVDRTVPQPLSSVEEKTVHNFEGFPRTHKGLFLAFVPEKNKEEVTGYSVQLINDQKRACSFRYKFYLNAKECFSFVKIVLPFDVFLLHEVDFDQLNESPEVLLEVKELSEEGRTVSFRQKLKPKNFFSKLAPAPLIETEAILFPLPLRKESGKAENAIVFDPKLLRQLIYRQSAIREHEFGRSESDVDLHLDAIAPQYKNLEAAEIMRMQVLHFQQALERAIAAGREKFYVIHGVGTGRLKNEIHRMLLTYREVKSFNNDFHARYGYGATEIFLK